jgi:hypothetical protein
VSAVWLTFTVPNMKVNCSPGVNPEAVATKVVPGAPLVGTTLTVGTGALTATEVLAVRPEIEPCKTSE